MKRGSSIALDDRALGRADVGDDAVLGRGGERRAPTTRRQHADGRGDERRPRRRRSAARRSPAARVDRADARAPASSAAGVGSKPATSAPSRSRAASPIEPPIRPDADDARSSRSARCRERPCPRRAAARSTFSAYSANSSARSCCGPSQIASSGSGCTSTMIPSAPAAAAASDSGSTSSRRPAAWLGSTIDRQVRELLEHRDRRQVEREAVGGLERADAALAQHHRSLPSLRMYSAAISSSSSVADSPRLSSTGTPGAADLGQQRVVLHVARADLDHVGDLEHRLEVARVHQLGDDRQARLAPSPRRAAAGPPAPSPWKA